jgi:hypothetical protein
LFGGVYAPSTLGEFLLRLTRRTSLLPGAGCCASAARIVGYKTLCVTALMMSE